MNRRARLSDQVAWEARPAAREYSIRDTTLPGFILRVRPTGGKTWVLRGLEAQSSTRISLGSPPTMSAEAARAKAHALRANLPAQAPTVSPRITPVIPMQFRAFSVLYRSRRQHQLKPGTMKAIDAYLRSTLLPALGNKSLPDLTRADIARWFHGYSQDAPGGANRALSIVQDMLKKAVDWGLLEGNAKDLYAGIKKNRRPPRGRLLQLEQIKQLGVALSELEPQFPGAVNAIRLILLTGCRSNEIRNLRWSEVQHHQLELEDSKTGPRIVQLAEPARQILSTLPRTPKQLFVFQYERSRCRPIPDLRPAWNRVRSLANLPPDTRLHDLRHTFASHAVMGGESLLVTGSLLGHRQSMSTARYAHLFDDFLVQAAEKIAGDIQEWMETGSHS